MTGWWVATFAVLAVLLALPPRARWPAQLGAAPVDSDRSGDWVRRWRWLWSALAGVAAATFVSGSWGLPAGALATVGAWVWLARTEPRSVRRRREATARELPGLVHLLAGALESGCDVAEALRLVCSALPGPAAELLAGVPTRLSLGVTPEAAWRPVLDDPQAAAVGRAMVRAHRSGSSVAQEVARLADDLERRALLRVEDRARAVGVKAAVPLGVCLLPSFLLIGIVPLVVGLLRSLSL
ncbi:MAG TPA: type II secretion system F family protein [Nocardioides sp.]|nr:type II secretion system F family protein [Nocardioides sp.]